MREKRNENGAKKREKSRKTKVNWQHWEKFSEKLREKRTIETLKWT